MNTSLAIQIRALANAIEATQDPARIIQHLKDLVKLAMSELRQRREK